MINPVEGQDYLVYHYAMLGVDRAAIEATIKKAYRDKQKAWHPDRLQGLAPELVAQGRKKSELLNIAYSTLTDPEKKSEYDALLAAWNKPISSDGIPVIDLTASGFSFPSLVDNLSNQNNSSDEEQKKIALAISGFSEATYEFFVEKAKTAEGIPISMEAAYAEQLASRDMYLSLLESFVWESVGMKNHTRAPRLEYREQVEGDIASVREQVVSFVEEQVLLLAMGKVSLLSAPDKDDNSPDSESMLATYQAKLAGYIDTKASELGMIVSEREDVINIRFDLCSNITYHPSASSFTKKVIVEIITEGGSNPLAFEFDDSATCRGIEDNLGDLHDPDVILKLIENDGYSVFSFNLVPDISVHSQLERALNLHGSRIS